MDRTGGAGVRLAQRVFLAGLLVAGLLGIGVGTAVAADQWTTTVNVTCNDVAAPLGIVAQGNLRDKQGRAMLVNGDRHFALFIANCVDNSSASYTFTTKHEPVEALLSWYVWDTSTRLLVMNCSAYLLEPLPVISLSSGSSCAPYGSSTVTITTAK